MSIAIRGTIGPGVHTFHREEVVPGRLAPMAICTLDEVRAVGTLFDLTDVVLTVQASSFDGCRFSQLRRPASDGSWGQGSLGRREAVYRDCEFISVRFRVRAGFSVGQARFERCRFTRCDFGEHFSFCADYIDCVFQGPVRRAVFYGTAPDGHRCDGKVNEIRGNDFRAATFGDVALRSGVSIEANTWPDGLDPATLADAP